MNRIETALVNSPPRRWLQYFGELPWLDRLGGGVPPGARVLEIGCGSGYGTHLLLERYVPARVDVVDLDPAMIYRAQRRLARYGGRVRFGQGSATELLPRWAPGTIPTTSWSTSASCITSRSGGSLWTKSLGCYARAASSSSKRSPPRHWPRAPTGCCSTTPNTTGSLPRSSLPPCGIVASRSANACAPFVAAAISSESPCLVKIHSGCARRFLKAAKRHPDRGDMPAFRPSLSGDAPSGNEGGDDGVVSVDDPEEPVLVNSARQQAPFVMSKGASYSVDGWAWEPQTKGANSSASRCAQRSASAERHRKSVA